MDNIFRFKSFAVLFLLLIVMNICSSAQTYTKLAQFPWGPTGATAYLVQGIDGNLYGTTAAGGTTSTANQFGGGTAFRMTLGGSLTTLHSFCTRLSCTDGNYPNPLILSNDGYFYGTTTEGGALNCNPPYGCGTVFRMTSDGVLTTLHTFGGSDGDFSRSRLVEAANGELFGTTELGGSGNLGTVFKILRDGTYSVLHDFNGSDGSQPQGPLMQAIDGNLYGTTSRGGAYEGGTIFEISLSGTLTDVYDFCPGGGSTCPDGTVPIAGLVQGSDGNFYGTTVFGGAYDSGSVFRYAPSLGLTTLYSFDTTGGYWPAGSLIQATDGNFYGTTTSGGTGSLGTIFNVSPSGTTTTLYNFSNEDGGFSYDGLLQDTDGNLYGTTGNFSSAFKLAMGLRPFVAFLRDSGKVGQTGGILGQGFTGTTSVTLNGTPASFTFVSDTFIRATIPAGATSGFVTVATPSGNLTSNKPFYVIP